MPAAATEPGPSVLAERGVGGYLQYRITGIVVAGSTLLCVFDARLNLDDLPAPIDLLLLRSEDGGRTWSEPEVIRTGTGFEGFGDPSLLTCPTTGRVFIFHSATVYAGFFESSDTLDDSDPHTQHADLSISEDGGRTWRHRRLSAMLRSSGNAHFDGERVSGLFATSGTGCAITGGPHAGRLVQPYVLRVGGRIHVACALNDDHGETWRLGLPVPSPAELNESSVAVLPDGRLVLHSRGVGARLQAYSRDGGETFSPAEQVPALVDSGTNGSVLAVGGSLFASHTADPDLRRRAVISRSEDGGATWREVRTITPGAAGYTQLVALPGNRIGVVYEANGYQQILFERFRPDELDIPRADSSTDSAPGSGWCREHIGGLVFDVVLRSITPEPVLAAPGEGHRIDLAEYGHIPTTVFKEIGHTGDAGAQVIHTRETLRAAPQSRPAHAAVLAGETLTFHARVQNLGRVAVGVEWAGHDRVLAPGDAWIRRDLTHTLARVEPAGSELTDLAARPRAMRPVD